ncbi:hypothetical protein SDC9_180174 [bioreactor metagenome]|uniref:Uncharacterized protein n=1 Tax=bioreactor metagenome TaxID=1076179 RepID=A0A645H8V5_9ZZZZ
MRTQRHHMAGPVVFLVLPGFFMFFDPAFGIVDRRRGAEDADLFAAVHHQLIQIQMRLSVALQRHFGGQPFKGPARLGVNRVAVQIGSRRQIDFRPGNMEKAVMIACGQNGRFLGIHHVVWHCGHLGGAFRDREQTMERFENRHDH